MLVLWLALSGVKNRYNILWAPFALQKPLDFHDEWRFWADEWSGPCAFYAISPVAQFAPFAPFTPVVLSFTNPSALRAPPARRGRRAQFRPPLPTSPIVGEGYSREQWLDGTGNVFVTREEIGASEGWEACRPTHCTKGPMAPSCHDCRRQAVGINR